MTKALGFVALLLTLALIGTACGTSTSLKSEREETDYGYDPDYACDPDDAYDFDEAYEDYWSHKEESADGAWAYYQQLNDEYLREQAYEARADYLADEWTRLQEESIHRDIERMEDAWVDDIVEDAIAGYDRYLGKETRKRKRH